MDRKIDKVKQALLAMQRHAWEQGVTAQAFLELGDHRTAFLLAHEAACRQAGDGRLAMVGAEFQVTDPAANGEAVWVAAQAGDDLLGRAADRMLDYLLHAAPRANDGTLYHVNNLPQVWVDSFYMAPPFLAVAGRYREACQQIEGMRKRLWLADKKLFAHIWNEERQDFDREDCWGVGNGWAAAGMMRVLRSFPGGMENERTQLAHYIRDALDGCLKHLRPDGLFHNVVDDPNSFVESNLSQMLAYTIYRGLQGGWLEAAYETFADRMRRAAHARVDEDGYVRDVCGAPEFDHPGIAPEGQAFFLLMEAAARDAGAADI